MLVIATIDGPDVISSVSMPCAGPDVYQCLRMLQLHRVKVLICNGIKASYLDMLTASGVTVFPKVSMSVDDALRQFIAGKLASVTEEYIQPAELCPLPHEELVDHARTLFEEHGYTVSEGPGQDAFLIDLVAMIDCPVCNRPVRVAICCGAHTYRPEQEIAEFHCATSSGCNARVFVCPSQPAILSCCREYGIQLIDPDPGAKQISDETNSKIPLLEGLVIGHERACCGVLPKKDDHDE